MKSLIVFTDDFLRTRQQFICNCFFSFQIYVTNSLYETYTKVFSSYPKETKQLLNGIDESSFKYIFEVCVRAYTPP